MLCSGSPSSLLNEMRRDEMRRDEVRSRPWIGPLSPSNSHALPSVCTLRLPSHSAFRFLSSVMFSHVTLSFLQTTGIPLGCELFIPPVVINRLVKGLSVTFVSHIIPASHLFPQNGSSQSRIVVQPFFETVGSRRCEAVSEM